MEELKKLLPLCLLPDQVRIGTRLARALKQMRNGVSAPLPIDRWLAEARTSIRTREARAALSHRVRYPEELPITARREDVIAAIRQHQVVIVAGETGSGKTTQLPKMCLEAGLGQRARIGCTQPRRVAAMSISRRVAEELNVEWGRGVGCKIRFSDHSRPETSVKFMTDGILLAEVQGDPLLTEYDAIILDEAHERSLNIDFLLGYLKLLLQRRDDLKLIVTSATIDTQRFSQAFGSGVDLQSASPGAMPAPLSTSPGAPVIEVSGRMFPVEVRYAPFDELAAEEGDFTYIDAAASAVDGILGESRDGDILIFMPGERDIRETCDLLRTQHGERLDVVPLFGRLSSAEQQSVFSPGPRRRVVVATNVAETSLTVPRIRYVVDTGLARISRYHPGTRSKRLPIEPVSQSSANQRQGRCGRIADGICIRLFAEEDFQARRPFTEPEIQRCDLADVILRMKAFRLGEIESFPFIDPPSPAAISGAYQLLQELAALDEQRQLTDPGRDLARLPVDPAIGRMILEAQRENALADVLVIAAGLSIQDPRERPLEKRDLAEAAHRRFLHPQSDFLSLLNIWNAYHDQWESLKTQGQLRKFCKSHFLSFLRMREWVDIHAQLEDAVGETTSTDEWCMASSAADPAGHGRQGSASRQAGNPARHRGKSAFTPKYAAVHRSILTGLFGHVAQREQTNVYRLGGNKPAMIFPGSGLFHKAERRSKTGSPPPKSSKGQETDHAQPRWLVAGELMETSRLFLRIAAAVDPEWVIELAPHLVRTTHENPHWDRESGRVLCTEKVLLRGLILREEQAGYLQVNPAETTTIFIRSALIEEDIDATPYRFLEHNRQMREKVEMWQTRLPHRLVPDLDDTLFTFYAQRLHEVGSTHDLNRLLKAHGPSFLCATESDLLGEHARTFDAASFPDAVPVDGHPVSVKYAYAPGEERDGVTLRLTVPLAERINPERLAWLVPALREERVSQLLDRLPKALRRQLMPLKHTAREILLAVEPQSRDFLAAMSAFIRQRFGVDIPSAAWAVKELPEHLRPRYEIVGKPDQPLATGRNLSELCLKVREHQTAAEVDAWQQAVQRWERYGMTAWDFGDLPEQVFVSEAGGFPLFAYPGLQVEHGEVNLRLFRKREEARAATREAVPRLAERALQREMGWLEKDLRALHKHGLLYATLGTVEALSESALDCLRRHLFRPVESPVGNAAVFAAYVEQARRQIAGLAMPFIDLVGVILQRRQEVAMCRGLAATLRAELDALAPPDLLRKVSYDQLTHFPRYLQALRIRVERAALNPAKDAEKAARVKPYMDIARGLRTTPATSPAAHEKTRQFLWLLEEFKVSVFAQELKTAVPVSPKKLDELLAEIRETR
jgi:ATP-dependent helicase HrpA